MMLLASNASAVQAPGPQLADIHMPLPPSWWPPAPGWWIVAVILLVLLVVLLRWMRRRARHARLREMLRVEFQTTLALTSAAGDEARQVAALSSLLRRAALRFAPQAAPLQGEQWLEFLDAENPAKPFSRGPGRLLLDGPYRPSVDADAARALAACVEPRLIAFFGARDA